MAKKASTKKVTRREAVALIGASAMFGAPLSVPVRGPEPSEQIEPCAQAATVFEHSRSAPPPHKRILFVDGCCTETSNAILVGVEHTGRNPTPGGKKHLKPLQDKLVSNSLAEYVYMIWGLSEAEVKTLRERMPLMLNVDPKQAK